MAIRSGAGTGVKVALVVFIMTTVLLLVLTIAFYGSLNKEKKANETAQDDLKKYVSPQERSSDRFKEIESAAQSQRNVSVASYLNKQMEDVMQYVHGDTNTNLEVLKETFSRTVGDNSTVRSALTDLSRDLQNRELELDNSNQRLEQMANDLSVKDAQIEEMRKAQAEELGEVQTRIDAIAQAAEDYRVRVEGLERKFNIARDELRDQYEGQVDDLENEIDTMSRDNAVFIGRLNELENRLNSIRIQPQNPASLVDGKIIDTVRGSDRVFINRGRRHHITRGLTFEVYDDASSIRINSRTGEISRGKASIEVIEVGDITSTCRLTRSVPGRPVIANDAIFNAIYDPEYQFKFLIHGKFDVDYDGRPTEAEAEYLRSRVVEWGGEIIIGSELPGNLDFLVLGDQPPKPIDPPPDAQDHVINIYLQKLDAYENYNILMSQAQNAQIPILNSNRFLILIGHTQR